jgi:spermidine/putrescine transport system permease protein
MSGTLALVGRCYLTAAFFYLFAPVFALLLFSFQAGAVQAFPFTGPTLHWYAVAFDNPAYRSGLRTSVVVAGLVALISTALGFASAHLLCRGRARWPLLLSAFVSIPAFVPLLVSGLFTLAWFQRLAIDGTLGAIVAAQVCYCSPFAFVLVFLAYQRLDPALEHAAVNLGANPASVLVSITLPQLRWTLIAALLMTALVSWDEFILAFFVGGFVRTLPTVIYSAVATSFDPSVNAVGVVVTAASAMLLCLTAWLLRDSPPTSPRGA